MRNVYHGPNGWYIADADSTGTHRQPSDGGRYKSKAGAVASENQPDGQWVDYDGCIYDDRGVLVGRAESEELT